jgi:hypothetical protein
MKDKEKKDLIGKGHIHIKLIFEMVGNPKEHVEQTLKQYMEKIKEDNAYKFFNEYYAPCEEKDDLWSTFFESDVMVEDLEKLNILCFNLGPASIEIIEPESFDIDQKKMTYLYNDLLSKLHETGVVVKSMSSENELLKLNLNRSIRNNVALALHESRSAEDLSMKVGIDKDHLQPFLDAMIREKSIILQDGKYVLIKK